MIGLEQLPSASYLALFHAAVDANAERMAGDLLRLARRIRHARPGEITLVSLARAGTPVGVLLRRILADLYGVDAAHYSISVIRDRGLDTCALDYILARHASSSVVFVDGWTAKGAIAGELVRSVRAYNAERGSKVPADLFVLCDLAGLARACGSADDYLIPSALLNASISGLVSRSILNEQIAPGQFHGCLFYADWHGHDLSRWFIDRLMCEFSRSKFRWLAEPLPDVDTAGLRQRAQRSLQTLMQHFDVNDPNFIKPGIGEATRALLRRAPRLLLLRNPDAADVRHLVQLAAERGLPVRTDVSLSFHALAIIRKLADG
jgi:hypothetical protein